MDFDMLVEKTDWRELQRQKRVLQSVIGEKEESNSIMEQEDVLQEITTLNGLVSFLDHIQDCAADVYGVPEEEVFDR